MVDVGAAVTSLSVSGNEIVVGTVTSDMYQIRLSHQSRDSNSSRPRKVDIHRKNRNSNNRIKSLHDDESIHRVPGSGHRKTTFSSQKTLKLDLVTPELELLATCHSEPIYDVTFPR